MSVRLDHTVDIGTDVASFFLFHPDDLVHRKEDPLDWYDYGFACRKEFEAGNLVAFRTGGDGGYRLRLTGGDLTDAERQRATGSWEWGYTVRHGKILVDNGDYLPSEEAFDPGEIPEDRWVSLPGGDYRVTVHPIAREDDSLPDYVIRFEPVSEPLHIALSPSPPDLIPLKDSPPRAVEGGSADGVSEKADDEPLAKTYPLLVETEQYVLPGGSVSVAVSDDLFMAVRSEDDAVANEEGDVCIVFAPGEEIPGLATLAWVNGSSQVTGEPGRLNMHGERLVRVMGRTESKPLPMASVEPVTREGSRLSGSEVRTLQAAFERYAARHAGGRNRVSNFERERVAAMTDGAALTTRLIQLIALPVRTRFQLQGASDAERARELAALLESA